MTDELTLEFLIESQEGLDRMERCLTELEERPDDAALIGDIFRSVHTIKGTTGFLGFKRLEKLAHAGENLLGMLRDGKLRADGPITTGLLELLDGLRAILKTIEAEDSEGDSADDDLIMRLEELQEPARQASAAQAAKGTAKQEESSQGAVAAEPAHPGQPANLGQPANPGPSLASLATATPALAPNRAVAQTAIQDAAASDTDGETAKPRTATAGSAAESTLRVDVALLNRLMNLVGELVLTRNQVLQVTAGNPHMSQLSRRLDMVTADLRESVMRARMQPVSNIFSKMPRIVRDLSQSLGRKVRLEMEGQDTDLDKSLLEAIKDPLTHAVRNSLDHGIEPPDVRIAAGKDAEGTLRLLAVQEGSHVVIEVADDGAGISVERVRAKAIERGLIAADRASLLGEHELLQLIFLPGFSTAAAVSNVSGRGVGMDVVKTNVEKIGGKVEIESRPGNGTTLRLRIPLTLAIIPALIVRSVGQSFALPQGALSELVHVLPEDAEAQIEWMQGAPLYRLRGKLLPLVFLDRMLIPDGNHPATTERDNFIAVLNADGRQFGLVVDGLADPEEIVVKPVSGVLKNIGIYSGATMLGNAELALILDPSAIARRANVAVSVSGSLQRGAEEGAGDEDAKRVEYLLVEIAGRQAAVPLADVLRIEKLKVSRIEYIGYRPVLNFEGQLLPVEDAGGVLAAIAGDDGRQVIIVVCRDASRQVGIAVSQVLDVSVGAELFEAGSIVRAAGVTLLKSRVTGVVNLGGAASLPGDEGSASPLCEVTDSMVELAL